MFDTNQILEIAKVSQFLASVDVANGALFGAAPQPALPQIIYTETKSLEWLNGLDPTNDALFGAGEYLLALCGKYAVAANSTLITNQNQLNAVDVVTDFDDDYIYSNLGNPFRLLVFQDENLDATLAIEPV